MSPRVMIGAGTKISERAVVGVVPEREPELTELRIGAGCDVHNFATIYYGSEIGDRNRIYTGVFIREHNRIGNDCAIGVHTYLGPGNLLQDEVKIQSNCFLEDATVGQDTFLGPHVVLLNDPHPRCSRYKECVGGVRIGRGVRIGANASILPGIVIADGAIIGAGSVVTKNVPRDMVACGNPARTVANKFDIPCRKGFFPSAFEVDKHD